MDFVGAQVFHKNRITDGTVIADGSVCISIDRFIVFVNDFDAMYQSLYDSLSGGPSTIQGFLEGSIIAGGFPTFPGASTTLKDIKANLEAFIFSQSNSGDAAPNIETAVLIAVAYLRYVDSDGNAVLESVYEDKFNRTGSHMIRMKKDKSRSSIVLPE